ncbi:hypothetical protein [Halosimplex halophilum]|uniref:hypothetical protein n=1 Tax=Halosimplex halophilum TaxID=2559572 RepID=UPI00107F65FB|nr:hypothetical protein [Halosimplex halophilum]
MTTSNRADHDGQGATDGRPRRIDRRTVLKAAGGTAVAVTAFSGTASAHNGKFFGCERVCSGTDGDYAVVAVDDGYECRLLEKRGPREDVPWDWDAHCYTAAEGEVVVGYVAEDEYKKDEGCWLCLNPNDCAETRNDDARAVRDALDTSTCSPCEGEMNISIGCEPATGPTDDGDARDSGAVPPESDSEPDADADAETGGSTGPDGFPAVVDQVNRLLRAIRPDFRR